MRTRSLSRKISVAVGLLVTRRIRPCIPVRFPPFLVVSLHPSSLSVRFVHRSIQCNTALPHPARAYLFSVRFLFSFFPSFLLSLLPETSRLSSPLLFPPRSFVRFAVVHPRHLLSYYFVGARGRQVYLSFYTALLSSFSFFSPRAPHINIAVLSERFIAVRSLPRPRGPGSPRRRRRRAGSVPTFSYQARADRRTWIHSLRLSSTPSRSSLCPCLSPSSSCPSANYNDRFRGFSAFVSRCLARSTLNPRDRRRS